jgi:hypothetical protein
LVCSDPPKVAVTALAPVTVTVQAPVPVHPPDQPANVLVVTGLSARVTCAFGAKAAVQVVSVDGEQVIPAGVLVTVPLPAPARLTVKGMPAAKLAVAVSGALMVIVQVVPEQLPLHPLKERLALELAVSVTCDPCAKPAVHVVGQLIPPGLLITVVPVPPPLIDTVNSGLKLAVTLAFAVKSILQLLAPVQPPVQPPKR